MIAICLATLCQVSCIYEGYQGGKPEKEYCLCYDKIEQKDLLSEKIRIKPKKKIEQTYDY